MFTSSHDPNPSSPHHSTSDQADSDKLYMIIKEGKNKKFMCSITDCQKVFRFQSEMQRHIASHSNFRPHKCTFEGCAREFKRTSALENHIRSQHTGEAPLVCPNPSCGMSFSTEAKFRYHMVSHLDEKPHKCTFPRCDKAFMTLSQLKQHEKSPSVHKKLDIMAQLEEKGQGHLASQLGISEDYIRKSTVQRVKEPAKKIKYDIQNKRLCDLLNDLQCSALEKKVKIEEKKEPVLDNILTENELLRQKLERSEQMLEAMKRQINFGGKVEEPQESTTMLSFSPETVIPSQPMVTIDNYFTREADSYLIHDTFAIGARSYYPDGDFQTRSESLEETLAEDKLSFFFPSFAFEEFGCSPSRQYERYCQ